MKTEVDVYFPRVHLEGLYKGEGRFNDFKMNSKGYFNVTMSKFIVKPVKSEYNFIWFT